MSQSQKFSAADYQDYWCMTLKERYQEALVNVDNALEIQSD